MVEIEKKKITLSIPVETNGKLEELSKKYGMTKSGLVNFLINQVAEAGTIYKKKKRPVREDARKIVCEVIIPCRILKIKM